MRRLLNFCLLLVLLGAVGFVLWKSKLLPFGPSPGPDPNLPPVKAKARDTLRVAVADRPERLLVSALHSLLKAKDQKLEVVDYNPETVWLELSAGEIDVVIAPLGEAVKAQGRFHSGRFLFASGLSQGYDQIRALKELTPKSVGLTARSGQELFSLANYPDASLMLAEDHTILEGWLREGAVEAAVFQSAALSEEMVEKTVLLAETSAEKPEPTIVILSRVFEDGATEVDLSSRIEVLKAALASWEGLVGYLETQPELLRSNLNKEAEQAKLDVDKVLADYRFLTPAYGRAVLEKEQSEGLLQQTLDLLILANVPNLTAPEWSTVLAVPSRLESAFPPVQIKEPDQSETPSDNPTPEETPSTQPTPSVTEAPKLPPPPRVHLPGSYHAEGQAPPATWPKEEAQGRVVKAQRWAPAVSLRAMLIADSKSAKAFKVQGGLAFEYKSLGALTVPPVSDGVNFFLANAQQLDCVDAEGKTEWSQPLPGAPVEQMALAETSLVVATSDGAGGRLLCLDTTDGRSKWSIPLSEAPTSAPVLVQGSQPMVVLGDKGGRLRAWNFKTGSQVWNIGLEEPVYIAPAAHLGRLAICYSDGRIRLFSAQNGEKLWGETLDTSIAAPPTVTRDYVLVPGKDTYLYALSRQSGDGVWKVRLNSALSEPAVVVAGHILQSDEDGRVHLADGEGNLLSSDTYGTGWVSRPIFTRRGWAISDGAGFVKYYKR